MQILRNRESNYKFCFGSHQRALCHVVTRFVALIEYAGPPKNISAGRSSKSASECPSDAFLLHLAPSTVLGTKQQPPPDQNPSSQHPQYQQIHLHPLCLEPASFLGNYQLPTMPGSKNQPSPQNQTNRHYQAQPNQSSGQKSLFQRINLNYDFKVP